MTTTTEVRERPILFSGSMVRALLDGSKTQTRRVVKMQPDGSVTDVIRSGPEFVAAYPNRSATRPFVWKVPCPYGQPGDRLWVRETWAVAYLGTCEAWCYAADHSDAIVRVEKWKPSIHMPRRLSRLTLEISEVRVQRLQEMNANDAIAEGIPSRGMDRDGPCIASAIMYLHDYEQLWDSLNAKRGYSWESNPWVWALTFAVVRS